VVGRLLHKRKFDRAKFNLMKSLLLPWIVVVLLEIETTADSMDGNERSADVFVYI